MARKRSCPPGPAQPETIVEPEPEPELEREKRILLIRDAESRMMLADELKQPSSGKA